MAEDVMKPEITEWLMKRRSQPSLQQNINIFFMKVNNNEREKEIVETGKN